MDWLSEQLSELRDHWDDSYWWADHPELRALVIGIITGLLGLLFAWLQLSLERRYRLPQTKDIA
jgi:hypothetical protein